MTVLLSIKPEYVEKIISGKKKYEFRRAVFKKKVNEIFVYNSSPVKRIVAKLLIGEIINDDLENLWKISQEHSGITKDVFLNYFSGKESGFAIEIKRVELLKKAVNPKEIYPSFVPPQSFRYLDEGRQEDCELLKLISNTQI